jgi:DNA-directed RNA polymerase specialized sigma24 family protein
MKKVGVCILACNKNTLMFVQSMSNSKNSKTFEKRLTEDVMARLYKRAENLTRINGLDGEMLVAETCISAFKKFDNPGFEFEDRDENSFIKWMMTILRNKHLDELKKPANSDFKNTDDTNTLGYESSRDYFQDLKKEAVALREDAQSSNKTEKQLKRITKRIEKIEYVLRTSGYEPSSDYFHDREKRLVELRENVQHTKSKKQLESTSKEIEKIELELEKIEKKIKHKMNSEVIDTKLQMYSEIYSDPVVEGLIDKDRRAYIARKIEDLKGNCRGLVTMYRDNYSYKEISAKLGITGVGVALKRCLETLVNNIKKINN